MFWGIRVRMMSRRGGGRGGWGSGVLRRVSVFMSVIISSVNVLTTLIAVRHFLPTRPHTHFSNPNPQPQRSRHQLDPQRHPNAIVQYPRHDPRCTVVDQFFVAGDDVATGDGDFDRDAAGCWDGEEAPRLVEGWG